MIQSDGKLEEALRKIAVLEKQLESRLKKKTEEPSESSSGPPSPIITTKPAPKYAPPRPPKALQFTCPKLRVMKHTDFSLPIDLIHRVRDNYPDSVFLHILPQLQKLPTKDFSLPEEYLDPNDMYKSPSLLSNKRKRRTVSPSLCTKKPRTLFESKDVKLNLTKNSIRATVNQEIISESQRIEEESEPCLIMIREHPHLLMGLLPFLSKKGSSTCLFLATYAWISSAATWSNQLRLLIQEIRVITSLQFERDPSMGTLYILYYVPDLSRTRVHAFHPQEDKTLSSSTLSHVPFSSVNVEVLNIGLVHKEDLLLLWGRSDDNTFFWNTADGQVVKMVPSSVNGIP
eukprot:TRINITY_DN22213_c0_g1_i1.p1 TRINITY_DN22213_c0_g1~~TRINITY_DN22213_c0_g1_i1.p1  ORF type:complete len:344 (+),score=42.08 TRINITY_DN22213_c0_g1_i1:43-1074(+)